MFWKTPLRPVILLKISSRLTTKNRNEKSRTLPRFLSDHRCHGHGTRFSFQPDGDHQRPSTAAGESRGQEHSNTRRSMGNRIYVGFDLSDERWRTDVE